MDDTPSSRCSDGDCGDALADLEAYLDGELPEDRLGGIRAHLAACFPCTGRATFEEQLRAIVRRDCVDQAPDRLLARIEEVLDEG
ncbi:MAG: mycothiol system anti-sigma-R factor [Nitriliruptoraceae bacterium]